jgi:hypothetical protein
MGSEFTVYDYIDADGDGANVIRSWLNGDGKLAKAYFTMLIPRLETSPPPGSKGSVWGGKHTKFMENKREKWYGFIELRKLGKVQFRLIGRMQDRSVFLVACGIHKGHNYDTDVSPQTALSRVTQMINNPTRYRRNHEYN